MERDLGEAEGSMRTQGKSDPEGRMVEWKCIRPLCSLIKIKQVFKWPTRRILVLPGINLS